MPLNRRDFVLGVSGIVGGTLASQGLKGVVRRSPAPGELQADDRSHGAESHPEGSAPAEALARLLAGNERFVAGRPQHPHDSASWREGLTGGQQPFAAVLGCSDSRVPPELVFDEGLGDLFVIRQAGHVADEDTLGSLEYAVEHLGVRLVAVLGHQSCGAVQAAVSAVLRDAPVTGHILRLVDDLTTPILEVQHQRGDLAENAIRANVRHVVCRLRGAGPLLRRRVRSGQVEVVGTYYSLRTGRIELLPV